MKKFIEIIGWLTAIVLFAYASHAVFAQTAAEPRVNTARLTETPSAPAGGERVPADGSRERREAVEVWERAVAAKGGRERLFKVETLVVSYGRRHETIFLHVFPDKLWPSERDF